MFIPVFFVQFYYYYYYYYYEVTARPWFVSHQVQVLRLSEA